MAVDVATYLIRMVSYFATMRNLNSNVGKSSGKMQKIYILLIVYVCRTQNKMTQYPQMNRIAKP